jgi:hypothetical protein
MRRLKIQRVKTVPPIPTTTIVIPNVQLSIAAFLPKDLRLSNHLISSQKRNFNKKVIFLTSWSRKDIYFGFNKLSSFIFLVSIFFGLVHEGFEAG